MNLSTLAPLSTRSPRTSGDPYLKLHLCARTPALLSMQHTQEAMVLPARRLTPMPNMPSSLLGLTNRRSRVLWVVDLAQMLGLPPLQTTVQQQSVVIIQVGAAPLGLAVHHVEGITWVLPETIQTVPDQLSTGLVPYLRGCVLQSNDLALVLDAEAIVQSPLLHLD